MRFSTAPCAASGTRSVITSVEVARRVTHRPAFVAGQLCDVGRSARQRLRLGLQPRGLKRAFCVHGSPNHLVVIRACQLDRTLRVTLAYLLCPQVLCRPGH